jgi:photosystem II stability/assembly factor-like uncharacterized protein
MPRFVLAGMFVCLFTSLLVAQEPAEKKEPEAKKQDDPLRPLKFRLLGPMAGGRVSRACGVPGDASTYYLGAAASGVWKTTDGGFTWKSIFDDQPTASIGAIAVAPSDANVVYVGSGEANIRGNVSPGNGIYRSTNGGKTWQHVWGQEKTQIGQIAIHPKNADIAFAAVFGSAFGPSPERGIYRTTDGGKTWKQVLKKDPDTGAIDVVIDPTNPRNVYAALWQARRTPWSLTSGGHGSGLYRSDDGGDSWKKLGPGVLPEPGKEEIGLPTGPWGRVGLAIAPSSPDRVFALIEAEEGGLYRTDDGGDTWSAATKMRAIRSRPWYFSTLTVHPTNPDVVWVNNVRLLKSTDGGSTFKSVKGTHHVDHHDTWIDPQNGNRIINSNDGGVDITTNGGDTWYAPQLPIAQFYHVNVDTSVPYRVMGNMQDLGTASGPSNSLSSSGVSLSDWYTVGGGETGSAIADPSDPNIVYAGEYGGILTRYDRRTRQARNISVYPYNPSGKGAEDLRYRFQWTAPILISPHDPHVLYHAANFLFRTRDQGKTWDKISPDLTRNDKSKLGWSGGPITGDNTTAEFYCTIFALAESPKQKGLLWAGSDDGRLHVSRDDGKKWTDVTKGLKGLPEWATFVSIEASPHDAGTAYVVADAHRLDDNSPYLWKTTDFGQSWTPLAAKLPAQSFLRVVREDPEIKGFLYVGSEHGISISRDGGDNWQPLKMSLPTTAVSDLRIKDGDLVVGTSGRSIYIFDDLTPIKRWSAKDATKVQLFPIRAATRWRYEGESVAGEDRMSGDNPAKGTIISYYLPKAPKEEIAIEVLDAKGLLVNRFTSKKQEPDYKEDDPDPPWSIFKPLVLPKEPGIQRVAWDLSYSGPKIIPNAKNDAGIPYKGPLVLPGTYTVKLKVDGEEKTQTVEVKMDPRVKLTRDELENNQRLAMTLRADLWRLSEIVIGLRSLRSQVVQRQELWEDDPKAKGARDDAKKLEKKLDELEEKLHNPEAEIFYDILAKKGGAKLYSQFANLYETVKESDGPVTQGMLEVMAEYTTHFQKAEAEWKRIVDVDVPHFNTVARDLSLPAVLPPRPGVLPPRGALMKKRSS